MLFWSSVWDINEIHGKISPIGHRFNHVTVSNIHWQNLRVKNELLEIENINITNGINMCIKTNKKRNKNMYQKHQSKRIEIGKKIEENNDKETKETMMKLLTCAWWKMKKRRIIWKSYTKETYTLAIGYSINKLKPTLNTEQQTGKKWRE